MKSEAIIAAKILRAIASDSLDENPLELARVSPDRIIKTLDLLVEELDSWKTLAQETTARRKDEQSF